MSTTMTCWSCGKPPGAGAFCEACGKVQPAAPGSDHFAALGLERRFAIEAAEIERRYRNVQRRLHPDRFVTKSVPERRLSLQRATAVNDAYRTLKDPLKRAEYMLALEGMPADGEASPDLLAEILELREELDAAKSAGDAARIGELRAHVRRQQDDTMSAIARAFEGSAPAQAAALVHRLRFIARFLEDASGTVEARVQCPRS
ncbi:MAG: Fe-S protein assembly co-chaperone HscB [Deltaproteobacteria bacterium]|nr:Fe-S protein assembly co-chaperone HscB [Deltaproteobacteria bacterium]